VEALVTTEHDARLKALVAHLEEGPAVVPPGLAQRAVAAAMASTAQPTHVLVDRLVFAGWRMMLAGMVAAAGLWWMALQPSRDTSAVAVWWQGQSALLQTVQPGWPTPEGG
jgi:hypothetical protein